MSKQNSVNGSGLYLNSLLIITLSESHLDPEAEAGKDVEQGLRRGEAVMAYQWGRRIQKKHMKKETTDNLEMDSNDPSFSL